MSIEDRIEAMVRSGALTEEQALKFRSSVSQNPEKKSFSKQKKRVPVVKLLGAFLIISVALIFISGNNVEQGSEIVQNVEESINQQGVSGAMNKLFQSTLSVIVILLPVLLCIFFVMYLYNNLISKEEEVFLSWSQVESQYQRRADLIPNLVSTVKGYADQEKEILIGVTAERSKITQALTALQESDREAEVLRKEASNHLDDEAFMARLASAQQRFSKNITGVLALVESYPELQSSDNFMALQDQIEGTENRINIARMVFNNAVNDFNKLTRVMPSSLIAEAGDFKRKAYFETDEGISEAPKVSFQ